jgi:hypothetical protein
MTTWYAIAPTMSPASDSTGTAASAISPFTLEPNAGFVLPDGIRSSSTA